MTLRVLQVLGRSAGGIARHVAQVVEGLDGVDGLVVDVAGPGDLPLRIPNLVHEVVIPDGPMRGHAAARKVLRRVIAAGNYDVVHAHGLRAGIDAGRAARRVARPRLLTVHNLVQPEIAGPLRARVYGVAESLAVRASDRVFAVSAEIAEHLRRRIPARADRIEVLYLGIGPAPEVHRSRESVRAELGLRGDQKLVATVARLGPQKALNVMLSALTSLPAHHLVILGEGPLETRLRTLIRELDLEERVSLLGFRSDVHDYVAAADAFCLSSIWEGVPLAAQEAILLEVPIVATAVGGLPELVEDGISGRLVPRGSPGALGAALAEVLDDPGTARRYALTAADRLRRRFSTPSMLARLRDAYRAAAGTGGGLREDDHL